MHKNGELIPTCVLQSGCMHRTSTLELEFYAFEKAHRNLKILQDNKVVWAGEIIGNETKQRISITVDTGKLIEIIPEDPPTDYSLVVSNMIIR
jgi:hypothetical protein